MTSSSSSRRSTHSGVSGHYDRLDFRAANLAPSASAATSTHRGAAAAAVMASMTLDHRGRPQGHSRGRLLRIWTRFRAMALRLEVLWIERRKLRGSEDCKNKKNLTSFSWLGEFKTTLQSLHLKVSLSEPSSLTLTMESGNSSILASVFGTSLSI